MTRSCAQCGAPIMAEEYYQNCGLCDDCVPDELFTDANPSLLITVIFATILAGVIYWAVAC